VVDRRTQNGIVLLAAAGAALAVLQTQTHWLSSTQQPVERERCYGAAREAKNDCATAKHSCAQQATKSRDREEWLMLPKGLCEKITGGIAEAL
jgi:uncharacterized membrane protein